MRQRWITSDLCEIGESKIRYVGQNYDKVTDYQEMAVLKPRELFERYQAFRCPDVRRIVEVGIFQGGSLVLFADLFPEAEILGLEIEDCNPAILAHIDRLGLQDRIKLAFGVSQDDQGRLSWLIDTLWGAEESLDLVIDDASHLYDPSVATFDILFPRLRTGGHYIIEDWGWPHWEGYSGELAEWSSGQRFFSSMILELVMAAAAYPDAVAKVTVDSSMAIITKGPGRPPKFAELVRVNGNRAWHGL